MEGRGVRDSGRSRAGFSLSGLIIDVIMPVVACFGWKFRCDQANARGRIKIERLNL